jgi:hypothetical protein
VRDAPAKLIGGGLNAQIRVGGRFIVALLVTVSSTDAAPYKAYSPPVVHGKVVAKPYKAYTPPVKRNVVRKPPAPAKSVFDKSHSGVQLGAGGSNRTNIGNRNGGGIINNNGAGFIGHDAGNTSHFR